VTLVADQNVMLWLAAQAAVKGDPVYDIGDPAFSFYVVEKGQVDLRMKRAGADLKARPAFRRTGTAAEST